MKRFVCRHVLLLVLLCGLTVATPVLAEPIKLTVLLPFSGVYSDAGLLSKQGFLLGVQQEAVDQDIECRSWFDFQFVDTRTDKARLQRAEGLPLAFFGNCASVDEVS